MTRLLNRLIRKWRCEVWRPIQRYLMTPHLSLEPTSTTWFGSDYGGWHVVDNGTFNGGTVISGGLGEDASFDPQAAVAEVKAEGLIKPTGRIYHQKYVLFLRAAEGKIKFLREYFDPTRAAKALDTPILDLEPS